MEEAHGKREEKVNKDERDSLSHPHQPLGQDEDGVIRFKQNKIVRFLLEMGQFDMNKLAMMNFSNEDRTQFAQLIGYSRSGFGDLSYVSDEAWEVATGAKK